MWPGRGWGGGGGRDTAAASLLSARTANSSSLHVPSDTGKPGPQDEETEVTPPLSTRGGRGRVRRRVEAPSVFLKPVETALPPAQRRRAKEAAQALGSHKIQGERGATGGAAARATPAPRASGRRTGEWPRPEGTDLPTSAQVPDGQRLLSVPCRGLGTKTGRPTTPSQPLQVTLAKPF